MSRHVLVCAFFIASGWCTLTSAELSSPGSEEANMTCIGDCPTIDTDCQKECGCNKTIPSTYDNMTHGCVIDFRLLILSLEEKYDTEGKIRAEADRIFKGVIVAAFFFIACASVCTLTACIYCYRINYKDHQLKKSIKILEKKIGKKSQLKKRTEKEPTLPMAESCNVVVEDAGVFCV